MAVLRAKHEQLLGMLSLLPAPHELQRSQGIDRLAVSLPEWLAALCCRGSCAAEWQGTVEDHAAVGAQDQAALVQQLHAPAPRMHVGLTKGLGPVDGGQVQASQPWGP